MTSLGFRDGKRSDHAGDWVEVRSAAEIVATLDARGCLEALPFMPEMLDQCGKRFRVYKSAHKTCDTIGSSGNRRMTNAVHLEGLRCDGKAHGGCEAGCLVFWKEAWLKRVDGPLATDNVAEVPSEAGRAVEDVGARQMLEFLAGATPGAAGEGESEDERYRCQATEMLRATTPLRWWDPRHYTKDLISRNVRLREFIRYVVLAAFNVIMRLHWRLRAYPYVCGVAGAETPTAVLNLQAGELVQVRSRDEIMHTLNRGGNRNRGLSFDVEMVPHCGKRFRVLRRVERIIDDKSGRMIRIRNPCLILYGATCSGYLSRNRLFCPRSIYPYWHEVWLNRVDERETAIDVRRPG